ncbi:MAG: (2Fe-2S)-binding protein [Planctomycetes bacterium]|nr:(2Fe-2S)-binding protein [Planctomycetota bacterium]
MSRLLCFCFKLTEEDLRRLVRAHRCATVEDVAAVTGACRGCQTCRPDIEALLREEAAAPRAAPPVGEGSPG